MVTQMVFETLMQPKYLKPLRAEAEKAIADHGWSEKALNSMNLLDSFIQEINRVHLTGSSNFLTPLVFETEYADFLSHLRSHRDGQAFSIPRWPCPTRGKLHCNPGDGDTERCRELQGPSRLQRLSLFTVQSLRE